MRLPDEAMRGSVLKAALRNTPLAEGVGDKLHHLVRSPRYTIDVGRPDACQMSWNSRGGRDRDLSFYCLPPL